MADKLVKHPRDSSVIERYADQGDGTWALVETSSGTAGSDKLVRNPQDASVIERYADMGDGTFARRRNP